MLSLGAALEIFLQAQPSPGDLTGRLPAHIAVVPGLVADTGEPGFLQGIAQDEAVLSAVLYEPFLYVGVLLATVQHLIAQIHDAHCLPQLVLAGSWHCRQGGRLLPGFLERAALGQILLHLVLKQGLLVGPGVVGGADEGERLSARQASIVDCRSVKHLWSTAWPFFSSTRVTDQSRGRCSRD